ncbi:hypothetical protein [Acinetobacter baumannii]|nr:hypothetical protein [Acinetobacter baumannii]MDP7799255.1 hypothetical protein [Acinetobacter baumannii]
MAELQAYVTCHLKAHHPMGFLLLCPTSLEHWIPMCWTGFLVDA